MVLLSAPWTCGSVTPAKAEAAANVLERLMKSLRVLNGVEVGSFMRASFLSFALVSISELEDKDDRRAGEFRRITKT